MITDLISQSGRYGSVHPAFPEAFAFLNSPEPAQLPLGSHERNGFTAVVIDVAGKGVENARLEYHERNIDIHLTLEGDDLIGWHPRGLCGTPNGEFDPADDIGFFADRPQLWIPVPVGRFAIFFPEDGHAPLAGQGAIRKIVLKIGDVKSSKPAGKSTGSSPAPPSPGLEGGVG